MDLWVKPRDVSVWFEGGGGVLTHTKTNQTKYDISSTLFQFLDGSVELIPLPSRISKKGPDWQEGRQHRNEETDEGQPCAKQSCSSLITAQHEDLQVTPVKSLGADALVCLFPDLQHQRTAAFHHLPGLCLLLSGDVSAPHHRAVLTPGAGCQGLGHRSQVRCELPGQMQRGAVRRGAEVRTVSPGWLRLLPGLRSRQRRALLPHSVGDARSQVWSGIILRVLQGRRRLRRRIWHL